MSAMSRLDQLASEIYGENGFSKLKEDDKELVRSLYKLEDAFDCTDFEIIEYDNIYE